MLRSEQTTQLMSGIEQDELILGETCPDLEIDSYISQ